MHLFVGTLHLKYLADNVIALAVCSLLNFAAGEGFVFHR
jgi:hypothetical protein